MSRDTFAMHILLDLDGTLTDPQVGITKSIAFALAQMGVCIPENSRLIECIGPPLSVSFSQLLPEPTAERVAEAIAHYRTRFSATGIFENSVYEGIQPALAQLTERGASLHLATSKPRVYARRILEYFELESYFVSVHGSEWDGARSHKADLIAYALAQEAIAPTQAVMVGDRAYDMVGAVANKIPAVGVLWGYGSRAELVEAGADRLLAQPSELAQMKI